MSKYPIHLCGRSKILDGKTKEYPILKKPSIKKAKLDSIRLISFINDGTNWVESGRNVK